MARPPRTKLGRTSTGIADLAGDVDRLLHVEGGAVGRLLEAEAVDQFLEPLAVLGHVDAVDAGADDRRAGRFQRLGQVERRLAAELHDHALRLHRGRRC